MYCSYCGKQIQDDANLCAYCGRRVTAETGQHRLVRPRAGRKIAGVCLAFAAYFALDVSLLRVVWLLVAILGFPIGLIAYLVAWIVIPEGPDLLPEPPAASKTVVQT